MSPNIRLFAISSDRWHGLETYVDINNKILSVKIITLMIFITSNI